jgi:hypothetical protein
MSENCANCGHPVQQHGSRGCLVHDPACVCPFDYDGKGTFNSKQLPVTAKLPAERLRGDTGRCLYCGAPENTECAGHCLVDLAYRTARAHEKGGPIVTDARDAQVGGSHYAKHRIQVWDIATEYGLSYIEGSALKYLLRRKGSRVEDLEKARHCLDRLIELAEEGEGGVLREEAKEAG